MFFSYRYSGQISDYEQYFDGASVGQAAGEFCTLYYSDPNSPERIYRHYPDIKLLLVLRHPVDQLYSHYWHLASQNFHTDSTEPVDFETALGRFPERLYRPALYGTNLARWLSVFSRRQLHLVLYDDLVSQPAQTLRGVYRFLGVSEAFEAPSLSVKGRDVRQGVAPRGELSGKIYRSLYDQLKRKVVTPLSARMGSERFWSLMNRLKVRKSLQTVFLKKGYPDLDPRIRNELQRRLMPEIQSVEKILGVDLSMWKR
jgi:hypothetical protein